MAPLLLLFFIFFASSSPLTHSRTRPLKTTTLDVASSLQKTTRNSPTSYSLKTQPSESTLSLQLLSRASIQKHHSYTNNYKLFTLSLLERDSARVKVIETRLDLALKREMQGPLISGTSQGSGEYFVRVGIGNPPSQAYLVIDTGSDVSWIQCAPCADCYDQADPIFQPDSSASYAPIPCAAAQCKSLDLSECRNGTCLYEVSYGDGSFTVGDFATETITLGSVSVPNVAIGCGHNNEGLFVGAAGLLGLGGGPLSFPEASFEVDSTGAGGVIVDSGTAVTRLKEEVYDVLRDAFLSGTKGLQRANGVALFDTCYDLSSKASVEVPTVSFHFPGGRELPLPAKNYLIPVDSVGTFCFAFAPTTSSLSIIGNVQQQGTRVGFDVANWVVGFSVDSC
ncbi:hypothetical protein Ahy_A05g022230 isoform A [Arachis hypogaea]|uniref:Peptidase A1 domain-containing protein n=1 Tax=Arachis hypogaea TaxID=3818 RepID=A0A445CZX8_ARAHY|nr:hypothetical protein Ahy_A05g022230 isoform A [Arachis hypogaea]